MRVLLAIPVLNEEAVLERNVRRVVRDVERLLPFDQVAVVIADNGSTDRTAAIAAALEASHATGRVTVHHLRLEKRGKGLAIRAAWKVPGADVYAFMDADLATDLAALPALIAAAAEHGGVAVGSRAHRGSRVRRSVLRRFVSFGYRTVLGLAFDTEVADAPCGFKAIAADAAARLLPTVRDDAWFFDTELVLRAEHAGIPVVPVAVDWRDVQDAGRRTKVRIGRVAREYVTRVLALRRELRPRTRPALRAAISTTEWQWVAGLTLLLAVLTLLPPAFASWTAARHGVAWSGRQYLSPADFGVYLTYIEQAANGAVGLRNLFTTEALPAIPNLLWMTVGWLSAVTGVSALAAYHAARVLLLAPLAFVAYGFIAHLFARREERLAAFGTLLFASGIGLLAAPFLRALKTVGGYEWPTDLWVTESNVFLSATNSPHFVASWTLLLLCMWLLCVAYDRRSVRLGAWAGVVGLALFQFHPFHALTLYAVGGIALLARLYTSGYRARQWAAYAAFVLLSFPTLAYHAWLACCTPSGRFMLGTNVTLTPGVMMVAFGFGAIGVLAVVGWKRETTVPRLYSAEHRAFLAAWTVTQLLLAYAPFSLQRRLLQGVEFPMVMLAVPAIFTLRNALGARGQRALPMVAIAALLLPSTFAAMHRGIAQYALVPADVRDGVLQHDMHGYFGADEAAAFAWLRANTAADAVVLALPDTGNGIAGWAMRTVYAGHWANTIDVARKHAEAAAFFGPEVSSAERVSLMQRQGIDLAWVGARERSLGGDVLARDPAFMEVYRIGGIALYRLR